MAGRSDVAVVGVAETAYSRPREHPRGTLELATAAVRAAVEDAGLELRDVDGLMTFGVGDTCSCTEVAGALDLVLDFHLDALGGGSSPEALLGLGGAAIAGGLCHTVVLFRAHRGYSGRRFGRERKAEVRGADLYLYPAGITTPAQRFALVLDRFYAEAGLGPEAVAAVKSVQSHHAAANPKALYQVPVRMEDVLASPWLARPIHVLEACVETDSGVAVVLRAANRHVGPHPPVVVLAARGRLGRRSPEYFLGSPSLTALPVARASGLLGDLGLTVKDVSLTSAYDAFTGTVALLLQQFGFCPADGLSEYLSAGVIGLGGTRPNNTSGGQLCEGYSNGLGLIVEDVRQLRWDADDRCAGPHTYSYADHQCRQVADASIAVSLGWGTPAMNSVAVLARGE